MNPASHKTQAEKSAQDHCGALAVSGDGLFAGWEKNGAKAFTVLMRGFLTNPPRILSAVEYGTPAASAIASSCLRLTAFMFSTRF